MERKTMSRFADFALRALRGCIRLLPFALVNGFADLLAFVVYHVVRYRRSVVRTNLKASYPNASDKQIRRIERSFYRHFARQTLASFKFATLSRKQALNHISLGNTQLLTDLRARGAKAVCLLMGHYGYWDYFTATPLLINPLGYDLYQIYRPLKDETTNKLMKRVREKFGAHGIAKEETGRRLISLCRNFKPGDPTAIVAFIADQTPSVRNVHLWTNFLRRPSAFFTGAERLATKLDLPVVYMDVRRISSNRYHGELILLSEHPAELEPLTLTRKYAALMEKTIDRNPAYWLWTHRRWKLDPQDCPAPFIP